MKNTNENKKMVLSQTKEIKHHADELSKVLGKHKDIESWVVGKIERASTDLSDVTHYLDGKQYAKGGEVGRLNEKDFEKGKVFTVGNTKIILSKKQNPKYYSAKYIDTMDNEVIGVYGSPHFEDVRYDILNQKYAKGGEVDDFSSVDFPTRNQTEKSAKNWLNSLINERGRKEAAKIVRYNLTGKNPYYRYDNVYDQWLSSATLNEKYAEGGGVGRTVMIPTFVVKEIKDSVKMGYDNLVEGMIGRKRKGVMLINENYEVRGTYDIGLKDAIQDLINQVKSGNFKIDAVDNKMVKGGNVSGFCYSIGGL